MPEKHKDTIDEEQMMELLGKWEEHLVKLVPQTADQEFGRVSEALRKIGARSAHRVAAARQNRCGNCNKVLPPRGPVDTIPRPAPELPQGWLNQFACSIKCADALRQQMHDREIKRLAAAQ